jgi:pyruvate dehydrogenase E1 component beta subunit
MANEIKLPAMSPTMEEGTLAKWLVVEGQTVKPGDVLAEIETDKATMELEADEGGTVGALLVAAGTDAVKVGTVIATIIGEDETATPAVTKHVQSAPTQTETAVVATDTPTSLAVEPETGGEAVKTTVREALRDAMAEEMRADPTVFVMGEESPNIRAPTRSRRDCWRSSGRSASSTHRSPNMALRASAPGPRWAA